MLQVICDKCGKKCDNISYDILVRVLCNPRPTSFKDKEDPRITCDNTSLRMILCQECYLKLNFPNMYELNTDLNKNNDCYDIESDD